jgi:hypothetical protein
MVYSTYNELITGAYKPTYNHGAPHCRLYVSFHTWGYPKMDDNCGYPQLRKPPWFYVGFVGLLQPRGGSSYLQFVFFQSINEHHEGLVGDTRDEPVMLLVYKP